MEEKKFDPTVRNMVYALASNYYTMQRVRIAISNTMRNYLLQMSREQPARYEDPEKYRKEQRAFGKYSDEWLENTLEEVLKQRAELTAADRDALKRMHSFYYEYKSLEERFKRFMERYVREHSPIYVRWLSRIRGIGPLLCMNLELFLGDCSRFPHPSAVWKYAGMHVVNGEAPKRRKGEKLDFRLDLRTLCWKLTDSFIKQRTPCYRTIYDMEKERQLELMEKGAENAPKSKLHADLRARRKAAKLFLQHYFTVARYLAGLPVPPPYPLSHLRHVEYIPPPEWQAVFGSNPPWKNWNGVVIKEVR